MSEPDIPALLALDAARTPGEWTPYDDECRFSIGAKEPDGRVGHVADIWERRDQDAIVAAVNALGPLCRRVEELTKEIECREAQVEGCRIRIEDTESQLAAANERIAGLEAMILDAYDGDADTMMAEAERLSREVPQ